MSAGRREAILLFAHGARDPDWAAPFRRIQRRIQKSSADTIVELCFLELTLPLLPDAIAALAARGITRITIVPLFLAQGGHLKQDLPRMIAQVQAGHPQLQIKVASAIGDSPALTDAIADWALAEHRAGPENR
ncbi:MAG: sirohydrochlorin chelatase [Burkholderiales bacterium]